MDEQKRSTTAIHAQIAQLQAQIRQLEAQLTTPNSITPIPAPAPIEGYHSEQRFRTLLDTASIAIIVVDNSGYILLANQKALDMFGYPVEKIVGAPVRILLPEHLQHIHDEHLNQFFANPRPRSMGLGIDLMARRQDGTLLPIEVSLSAIQSAQGVQGVAFIADISRRKREETRFRTLLDTASIATVVVDNVGSIRIVNQKASDIFGYTIDELVGSPINMLLPETLRKIHDQHLRGFFANPRPRAMGSGIDLVAQRRDGSLFPIEVSLSAIQSEDGLQGVAFIADITERRQNEIRFQILLDTASIAIVVVDNTGNIMIANQKASEIFGYTTGELIGSSVSSLLPEQLRITHDEHLRRFFANPRPRPMGQGMDLLAQRNDGTQFPIEVSLSAIQSDEGMQGVAFIVDISERKRAEQQQLDLIAEQERTKALQNFVLDVAHDLKTPMAAIMTRLHIIDKQLGVEAGYHTSKLQKYIMRINHLVDTMLVMTRLDMIEQLERQSSNINHLVKDMVDTLHSKIEAKGHQLQQQLDSTLPLIPVHPSYLAMAIKNILYNAAIFTPSGGNIEVITYQTAEAIAIEISDNGIGITAADLPHIFKRFYRADSARSMDDSINGLGLAISKRVIDLHQGQIEVSSEVGHGSTFKIKLPITPSNAPDEVSYTTFAVTRT